jgi:hypothetical protein
MWLRYQKVINLVFTHGTAQSSFMAPADPARHGRIATNFLYNRFFCPRYMSTYSDALPVVTDAEAAGGSSTFLTHV